MSRFGVLVLAAALACGGHDPFETLHVGDANPPTVRDKHGIIPGARLLASSSGYDVAELPGTTDSTLVFYCYNPM